MTSILERADAVSEQEQLPAPYRSGDRIRATSPEGTRYLGRVEAVQRTPTGEFSVLAAITEPRRFRSHLLTVLVGPDGFGPAVRPA